MADSKIIIEVFNGTMIAGGWITSGGVPDDGWGPTEKETYADLASALQKAYGQKIEINYIDFDRLSFKGYPHIKKMIQMGYSFPLIAVNGEHKFSGSIKVEKIMKHIEELADSG